MARHRAGPGTVQQAIAKLAARGLVEARPGRGTFVAARVAPTVADASWQTVALGARAIDADALETLLRPPAPGRVRALERLPARRPAADRGARLGARPRGTSPRRVGPRPARGHRRAARVLRGGGRRGARRRADLPRRSGGARGVPARARGAGRAGGRRGADLPRRAHRGARAGPRPDPGADRRPRRPPRPARRRARALGRAARLPAADPRQPARRDARGRAPARPCSTRSAPPTRS